MQRRIVFFLFAAVLGFCGLCFAQENVELERIVVTPSRTEESSANHQFDIEVLSGYSLEKADNLGISETLDTITGLDTVSAGKFGAVSEGVYIRGGLARHTAYMLEGMKIYDPSNPSSYYAPSDFSVIGLKRIEVVKSPLSSLYGSSPLSGAINFLMKNPQTRPYVYYEQEAGSFSTFKEVLEFGGKAGDLSYLINGLRLDTKGFSKAREKNGNPEADAYQNTNFNLKLNYHPDEECDLGLVTKAIHSRTENDDDDDYDGSPEDDLDNLSWNNEFFSTLFLKKKFNPNLSYKIQGGMTSIYRKYYDDNDGHVISDNYMRAHYKGKTYQFLNHFEISPASFYKALIGFDYTKETAGGSRYDYSYAYSMGLASLFPKASGHSKGVFIQNLVKPLEALEINFSYRRESHSVYKGHDVLSAGFSYKIPRLATKIYSSYSEGFKSPSLYQLYDLARGNRGLRPEESKAWQLGFSHEFRPDLSLSFCYFHSGFKNLIDFVYTDPVFWIGEFMNAAKAKSRGLEAEAKFKVTPKLSLKSGYTYTKAEQDFVDEDMVTIFRRATLRIPKHKAFLGLDWKEKKFDLLFDLSFNASRTDRIWIGMADQFVKMKPYFLANLVFNYSLAETKTIFLKINNLLDKDYERIKGYQEEKIAFYAGLRAKF